MPSIRVKKAKTPLMHMVVPGRRALGEEWRKVTISHDGDDYVMDNVAAPTPVNEKPIIVPMMGAVSIEEAEYIVGWVEEENKHRKAKGLGPAPPDAKTINQMWHDFIEAKLKAFKGQTSIGPAGLFQRQSQGRK
jgi:hypothetical protein